ncbi:ATP-binding protein [Rhizobacter sp. LjRoot28]|uniref:hybrid sensor histidine kinase/response regulator n=1 Tax=Rhizobacter sp. LjRoot28 TaxID=3342309 RepID=UPI003ECD5920
MQPAGTAASAPPSPPPHAKRRSPSVRRRLLLLTLGVLLPTSGISMIAAYTIYTEARQSITSAASETARALSLVADREVAYRAGILKTLAASPALDRGDLKAFYEQAKAVSPEIENAIMVTDPQGRTLINTRAPFAWDNVPPSAIGAPPELGRLDARPMASDLYMSKLAQQYSFSVWVPMIRDGEVRFNVSMGSVARQLQRIFDQQQLPSGWVGTLVDSQGQVLARSVDAEHMVGRRATPDMMARLTGDDRGVHETVTLEGTPVYTVFNRAPESGWIVLIGLPRAEMRRPALDALKTMLMISLAMWGVAALAAVWLGRSIEGPVALLQADAEALGAGKVVGPKSTGLAETDVVQGLLARASLDLRDAEANLQQRVRAAVEEAERAQSAALGTQKLEALGRLTGGIAHDFNNLLQTMSSGVQLAGKLATDPRATKALGACERAITKAVKLTRQLMSFGRAQPGHREVVDLPRQVDGLAELLRGAVRESITVEFDIEPGLAPVRIDPVQFELAILNLVLNARDAMKGGGQVTVRAVNRRIESGEVAGLEAGNYVAVAVLDTGHGIAPELLGRVFEPFFTTKPVGEGTGLGLAQVYAFAKQSGGLATVRSSPGHGTTVTLFLPATSEQPLGETPGVQAAPPPQHSGTVLMVEDDALVRGLTAQALEDCGFSVLVASTAADALAIARARDDIDAVLSDVVMPGGMSGVDLVHALAELRPALPALLVSGYAAVLDTTLPVRTIAKPYAVADVARLLAEAIRDARAARPAG